MTYHVAPPFFWGIAATITIYLAAVGFLMNYLKNAHRDVWLELGSPSLTPPFNYSFKNGLFSSRFVFSDRYRKLDDKKLVRIVWGVRTLYLLAATLLAVSWASNR